MDLLTFLRRLKDRGDLGILASDARAQFGMGPRQYLGATLLPERLVAENAYREYDIRFTTNIANDSTRYSPVQLKRGGDASGSFLVELGHQNIGSELSAGDYDALLEILNRGGANPDIEGAAQIIAWSDITINQALIQRTEVQRWQAIVSAQVSRVGDNGYLEPFVYPNPTGHRVVAGGVWSNDAYDPYLDIAAMQEMLEDKGKRVIRIVTSGKIARILQRNTKMVQRFGPFRTVGTTVYTGNMTPVELNAGMQASGLPPIETYDQTYEDSVATQRFLPQGVFVFLCATGRDVALDVANESRYLPDTQGYTAIGRAAGEAAPGRIIRVDYDDDPPHLEGRGRQASIPVLTDPESLAVISSIS